MNKPMTKARKVGLVAVAALSLGTALATPASAFGRHGGYYRHGRGPGVGAAIGLGIGAAALGAVAAGAANRYYNGYPAYSYPYHPGYGYDYHENYGYYGPY